MSRTRSPRPSAPVPGRLPLERLVADIDQAFDSTEVGTLLRVTGDPVQIAHLPLDGDHPLDMLLGFTAPLAWLAIGVHCRGRAYPLGPDPLDLGPPSDDGAEQGAPTPVVVTALVDRAGRGAAIVRQGSTRTRLAGPPEGLVGDACRRALDLPTAPPPPSTAELWLRIWLDRVVETVTFAEEPERHQSWEAVAALHPAATMPYGLPVGRPDGVRLDDPQHLAEATLALAEAWSWGKLRLEPDVVATMGPPMWPALASWMDDGMFARTLLGELAPLPLLTKTLARILPDPVLDDVDQAVLGTWLQMAPQGLGR